MLLHITNQPGIDNTLESVISTFEAAFPQRIRGYYAEGSYADGSGVTTSDLDLSLIFKERFLGQEERAKVEGVAARCVARCEVELDIGWEDEESLRGGIWPQLKMGSVLVSGEDVRAQFPLVPLPVWTRDRMHSSLWRTVYLFNRPPVVSYPLAYPDPEGEFYGYDQRKVRLKDGTEVRCTRDLIRLLSWSATALLAFQSGQYVACKSECHTLYERYIGDEWSGLLRDVYVFCRGRWNYLIPADEQERRHLQSICAQTLDFENHFLQVYKEFLLRELQSLDLAGKLQALWVLNKITYRDKEVEAAVRALESDETEEARKAAREVVHTYGQ